ncbi:MAG: gluconate 2-dehydrogenase subunit 3 family protein [Gammaproteobacteria bacterium]|nr:gluconate 2-dehydrogenase subunit 3 family protein [Gammaproteobacteria bacterium]
MTRREAIERVSLLLGGAALVGQSALLAGCASPAGPRAAELSAGNGARELFTAEDVALLDEVADTILPDTATPGAKAAGVGPFIAVMVTDAYDPGEQRVFMAGLRTLDAQCRKMHGTSFMAATPAQRLALLERLDAEQVEQSRARAADEPPHYFRMIKELALLGYFTSEIGYTQAMRYLEAPGRFDPCVPYAPGDKAWAPHA